jgi:hypothetical protein
MKNLKYIYIKSLIGLLVVATSISSCKDQLEIQPLDQIDASQALTTSAGVSASIATVYATLKGESFYGNRLIGLAEALADNGQATNKSGRYLSESNNIRGAHFTNWTASYVALNRINIVLEALPGIADATSARKLQFEGELKFLRALYHFDLVRTYAYIPGAVIASQDKGGVPILLKSINTAAAALSAETPRAPRAQVYKAIYDDLDNAIANLGNITNSSLASKQAAQALYSRVALYNKDFAKVISVSNDLITARGSTLLNANNYFAGFTAAKNPESLFEVTYVLESEGLGVNVSLHTLFSTLRTRMGVPKRDSTDNYAGRTATDRKIPIGGTGGFGDLVPTSPLISALGITVTGNGTNQTLITNRSSDIRNSMFEVGSSLRSNPHIECTKFFGKVGFVNVDNVPVLRIAEAYLNRAEAYAEVGPQQNIDLALADVNRIRTNRGLPAVSGLSGQALIDEILLQRRIEFAFEGHRFFDLKRRGLDIFKPVSNNTLQFDNFVILPGIPQGDVDASKGIIIQNTGY